MIDVVTDSKGKIFEDRRKKQVEVEKDRRKKSNSKKTNKTNKG